MKLKRRPFLTRALTYVTIIAASLHGNLTGHAESISPEEAHAIGVDAYLYFYPLITMDITRKQSTNIEPGKKFGKGPMNMFVSVPEYPPPNLKVMVRVNFDTLCSIAWLDLTREPQIISVPDTRGRYYLLPMLDIWTDVFASSGWRTTGTQAANFFVTAPGWTGSAPGRHAADQGTHALRLDHRSYQNRRAARLRCGSQGSGYLLPKEHSI